MPHDLMVRNGGCGNVRVSVRRLGRRGCPRRRGEHGGSGRVPHGHPFPHCLERRSGRVVYDLRGCHCAAGQKPCQRQANQEFASHGSFPLSMLFVRASGRPGSYMAHGRGKFVLQSFNVLFGVYAGNRPRSSRAIAESFGMFAQRRRRNRITKAKTRHSNELRPIDAAGFGV